MQIRKVNTTRAEVEGTQAEFHSVRRVVLLVVTMVWRGEHCGFAVRSFFDNCRSFIVTRRASGRYINLARHGAVSQRKLIAKWMRTPEKTGSTVKPRG